MVCKKAVASSFVLACTISRWTTSLANVISFDFNSITDSSQTDYFAATDVAGAPGERVADWNNVSKINGNSMFSLTSVHDSTGATIAGMTLNSNAVSSGQLATGFAYSNSSEYGGAHAPYGNDSKLFDHFFNDLSTTLTTFTITNVPYASYKLVFYKSDQESTSPGSDLTDVNGSVGGFTVGTKTLYVRGGPGLSSEPVPYSNTPDSTGSAYIVSSDTTNSHTTTAQGNTVIFTGLGGSTLTASVFAGDNVSYARNKIAGFQIVDTTTTPEPGGLVVFAGAGFLLRRHRRRLTGHCFTRFGVHIARILNERMQFVVARAARP